MAAKQYKGAIEYQYKLRVFHTTIPDVNARAFLLSQRNHCIRDVATTKKYIKNIYKYIRSVNNVLLCSPVSSGAVGVRLPTAYLQADYTIAKIRNMSKLRERKIKFHNI